MGFIQLYWLVAGTTNKLSLFASQRRKVLHAVSRNFGFIIHSDTMTRIHGFVVLAPSGCPSCRHPRQYLCEKHLVAHFLRMARTPIVNIVLERSDRKSQLLWVKHVHNGRAIDSRILTSTAGTDSASGTDFACPANDYKHSIKSDLSIWCTDGGQR